jgi:hypothetical protein
MGLSAAYKVTIKFDNEIRRMEGQRKISAIKIFDHIELPPPHKKICILVDTFASYLTIKRPLPSEPHLGTQMVIIRNFSSWSNSAFILLTGASIVTGLISRNKYN